MVQCYGPLGSGDQFSSDGLNRKRSGAPPLSNPIVVELAEKYRDSAQVSIGRCFIEVRAAKENKTRKVERK